MGITRENKTLKSFKEKKEVTKNGRYPKTKSNYYGKKQQQKKA